MTYTAPWDETLPLGSAPRNTVDDIIRALKRDLRERLVPAVFTDFDLDPLVLSGTSFDNVLKRMNIGWEAFNCQVLPTTRDVRTATWAATTTIGFATIILPEGVVIEYILPTWGKAGSGTASGSMRLLAIPIGGGSPTVLATTGVYTGNFESSAPLIDSISHTVDNGNFQYKLEFSVISNPFAATFALSMISLGYTMPTLESTL